MRKAPDTVIKLDHANLPLTTEVAPCTHCGERRQVAALRNLFELQRRFPVPGMTNFLRALVSEFGQDTPVAVCTNCFCITPDLGCCSD